MVMMQKCKDNQNARKAGQEWNFDDIKDHQEKMIDLFPRTPTSIMETRTTLSANRHA